MVQMNRKVGSKKGKPQEIAPCQKNRLQGVTLEGTLKNK